MSILESPLDFVDNIIRIPEIKSMPTLININHWNQQSRIAVRAYYKAHARHFEPGHELEDWLAAESELAIEHLRPAA